MKCTGAERTHIKTNATLHGSVFFNMFVNKQTQMGPPKVPQTVYFKLFGTFERVFYVAGEGGRLGRTHVRTHGRTPARRPTPLHNYNFFKVKKHQYALCVSVFGGSYVEKSLGNLTFFMMSAFHEVQKHQYALRFFSIWELVG